MMPDLKTILRLNASSCLGFGALFLALPQFVATFLGSPPAPPWLIGVVGAALIVNGLHLLHASRRTLPPKILILYFSGGDFAWGLGTIALIASGLWINHNGLELFKPSRYSDQDSIIDFRSERWAVRL